jgi:ligand-binding sensor domain-containing protein
MWLTTWGGDLYKINPFQVKAPYTQLGIPFYAFAEDNVNTLWMATIYGLLSKDSSGKVQRFLIDKDTGSVNNLINELVIDEENRIWTCYQSWLILF